MNISAVKSFREFRPVMVYIPVWWIINIILGLKSNGTKTTAGGQQPHVKWRGSQLIYLAVHPNCSMLNSEIKIFHGKTIFSPKYRRYSFSSTLMCKCEFQWVLKLAWCLEQITADAISCNFFLSHFSCSGARPNARQAWHCRSGVPHFGEGG